MAWIKRGQFERGVKARSKPRGFRKGGKALGTFDATAYGPPWGGIQGTGTTARGTNLKSGPKRYIVAVDPSVIPLGSQLKIWPNPFGYRGTFLADDTGGAIKGNRIDFYDWRGREAQYGWGHRNVKVTLVGEGGRAKEPATKGQKVGKIGKAVQLTSPADKPRKLGKVAKKLPKSIRQLLRSPGIDRAGMLSVADLAISMAENTEGIDDDRIAYLFRIGQNRQKAKAINKRVGQINRQLATRKLSPKQRERLKKQRANLLSTLGTTKGSIISDRQAIKDLDKPTKLDRLEADLALAGLTEGTGDDRKALEALERFRKGELDAALASGDPRKIKDAATELAGVREQLKSLTDTTRDLIEAQKALADELKRQNDLQQHVMAITSREATRAMTDFLSGQIAGRTRMAPTSGVNNQQVRI